MKEVDLRMLAERGVGLNASALTVPCGYVLQLETGKGLEVLRLQRGGERVFKTLDAVAALLGSVGITSFSVVLQSSVSLPPLIQTRHPSQHRKGQEQRSVDNCPAHRGQAPDGRPSVRQFPTSPSVLPKGFL